MGRQARPESTAAGIRHTNTWMLCYTWGLRGFHCTYTSEGEKEGLRTGKELTRVVGVAVGAVRSPVKFYQEMEKGDRPCCLSTDLCLRVVPPCLWHCMSACLAHSREVSTSLSQLRQKKPWLFLSCLPSNYECSACLGLSGSRSSGGMSTPVSSLML